MTTETDFLKKFAKCVVFARKYYGFNKEVMREKVEMFEWPFPCCVSKNRCDSADLCADLQAGMINFNECRIFGVKQLQIFDDVYNFLRKENKNPELIKRMKRIINNAK